MRQHTGSQGSGRRKHQSSSGADESYEDFKSANEYLPGEQPTDDNLLLLNSIGQDLQAINDADKKQDIAENEPIRSDLDQKEKILADQKLPDQATETQKLPTPAVK